MKRKIPLSYRAIQKIKAEEFDRFFSKLSGHYPYLNHLGEVRWMSENEAAEQHEYFLYSESVLKRWHRSLGRRKKINVEKLSEAERQIRLSIRKFLEMKYSGKLSNETERLLPDEWTYEISDEEIETIPLLIDDGDARLWKKYLIPLGGLVFISIIIFFWIGTADRELTGKLLVRSDIPGARVYLDEVNFIGYSNKVIINIPIGLHRITAFKKGYVSLPQYHEIEIDSDSLTALEFKFKLARSEVQGYLRIKADQKKSKIFVDNLFFGILSKHPVVTLDEGQHSVSLQREGFVSVPAERVVSISAGDTSYLSVRQMPLAQRGQGSTVIPRSGSGSIEVVSNIKGARIIVNGNDTGERTDYVFTQLPLGHYSIQLRKEGLAVSPSKIEVNLAKRNPAANARFELTRTFEKVKIVTKPDKGEIYIDGEFMGEGKYEGVLPVGSHEVSFGKLKGFKTPATNKFEVNAGSAVSLEFKYFPEITIIAEVDERGNTVGKHCDVKTGYVFPNRAFSASQEGGPSVEFHEQLNDYVWKVGYAFPYRNPKGNDAVKIVFELPRNLDYEQTFTLQMLAAASKDKYPLTVSSNIDITLKFNNNVLSYYYNPGILEEIGGLEQMHWDITSYVKPGINSFEVSTTEKNNTFYYLKRIKIFN